MKERLVQKLIKKATSAALVASMVATMIQPTMAMAAELDEEKVVVETEVAADMDVAEEVDLEGEPAFAYDGDVDLTNSIEIDNAEATYQYTDIGPDSFSNRVIRLDKYGDRIYFTNKTGGKITWRHQYVSGNYRKLDSTISNNGQTYIWNNITNDPASYVFFTYDASKRIVYTVCVRVSQWKFIDVWPNEKEWKYKAISFCLKKGIVNGNTANTYAPNDPVNRAMFATMLYNMAGKPSVSEKQIFPDVKPNSYYGKPVTWANQRGIITGYGDGKYIPSNGVERQQIAVMLMKYAKQKGYNTSQRADISQFVDAGEISSYAKEAVQWAVATGIIGGDNGRIKPRTVANRAESAALIQKYMNNIERVY